MTLKFRASLGKMAKMGVLCGMSVALVWLIHFPILPAAPWMEYDPADIPILIGTFLYGPVAGLVMTVVASGVQAITVSAQSGWIGFVMHVVATGTLALVSGGIYRVKKSRKGAMIALAVGAVSMVAVMIPLNLIFTPMFSGMPMKGVAELILPVIIPFNAIKAVGNCLVTFIVYKKVGKILKIENEESAVFVEVHDKNL